MSIRVYLHSTKEDRDIESTTTRASNLVEFPKLPSEVSTKGAKRKPTYRREWDLPALHRPSSANLLEPSNRGERYAGTGRGREKLTCMLICTASSGPACFLRGPCSSSPIVARPRPASPPGKDGNRGGLGDRGAAAARARARARARSSSGRRRRAAAKPYPPLTSTSERASELSSLLSLFSLRGFLLCFRT
uniref:Uncharacterized protein n=1 Tax=Oryza rufipogon TaxID=4529 RepID=A0A0E0PHS7_ORYRU